MARIRSIKPEFWTDEKIAAMDWKIVHDGPVPNRVNVVAPMAGLAEYVYLLFDAHDRLVYVGRSFRPADRFTKHRRKTWWSSVTDAVIVRIGEPPRWTWGSWGTAPPNTSLFEKLAITGLHPIANIVGKVA